jgi:hypothetical protein
MACNRYLQLLHLNSPSPSSEENLCTNSNRILASADNLLFMSCRAIGARKTAERNSFLLPLLYDNRWDGTVDLLVDACPPRIHRCALLPMAYAWPGSPGSTYRGTVPGSSAERPRARQRSANRLKPTGLHQRIARLATGLLLHSSNDLPS